MARLVGYVCNDRTLTHQVVEHVREALGDTPSEPTDVARGFGWFREGQSLLRKQPPQGIQSGGLGDVLADIRSREIVGYERDEARSHVGTSELQPFSFRTWLFAASEVSGLDDHREAILEDIPDHIRHNIEGTSGEGLVFHRFLASLHDRGGFGYSTSEPEVCVEACADALHRLETIASNEGGDTPLRLGNAVLASERFLLAARFDTPMYYRMFEGIEESTEEPLFAGHRPQGESHEHFRGLVTLNGFEPRGDDWKDIPARSLLWIDDDWTPTIVSIDEVDVEA